MTTQQQVNAQSLACRLTGIIEGLIENSDIPVYEMRALAQAVIECHEMNPILSSERWVMEWKERYAPLLAPVAPVDDLPY